MRHDEYFGNPAIQNALSGFIKWREDFTDWLKQARKMRNLVAANASDFPNYPELICLLDERIAMLSKLVGSAERMVRILSSAGQASEDPVAEMETLMSGIHTDLKILKPLTDQVNNDLGEWEA